MMLQRLAGSMVLMVSMAGCSDAPAAADAGSDAPAGDAPGTDAPGTDAGTSSGDVPADILRTCSFTNACSFGPVVNAPIDRCVESLVRDRLQGGLSGSGIRRQQIDRLVRCAGTAASCDAFVRCARLDTAPCTVAGARCEGQVAVTCSSRTDNVPEVVDCAALGLACDAGDCVGPAPAIACDATVSTNAIRCDGTALVRCERRADGTGIEVRDPCPAGAACVAEGRSVTCLPAAPVPCATPGTTCEGSTVVQCLALSSGMRALRQDCGSVGMTCGMVVGGSRDPQCIPAGAECTAPMYTTAMPSSGRCEGADIVACVLGRTTRVRCADFGATGCATVTLFPICR